MVLHLHEGSNVKRIQTVIVKNTKFLKKRFNTECLENKLTIQVKSQPVINLYQDAALIMTDVFSS